jgi:hypothetical protein
VLPNLAIAAIGVFWNRADAMLLDSYAEKMSTCSGGSWSKDA